MLFKLLGFAAAFLTTASFLPQAIKSIKEKDTRGISLSMYIMFTAGVFLWLIYGLFLRDIAISAANLVTFIFAALILRQKVINWRKGEK